MAKLNRRQLLASGLLAGLTGPAIAQSVQAQSTQPNQDAAPPQSADESLDAILGSDAPAATGTPQTNQPLGLITVPIVAYNREMSQLLIQCSHIGIEQFERGQQDPRYNGSIRLLESYRSQLDRYRQVAAFRVTLDATTTLLPNLGALGNRIVRRILNPTQVFIGFALASETDNIIVFRGTTNPKEWVANFQARQTDYVQAGAVRGQVHTGFLRLYSQLSQQIRSVVNQLNPAVPCYVAGHSLGGALATLACTDLAQNYRSIKDQLQLYSYAAPRVGNLDFAKFSSAIAPNTFRIINLADIVPMVPPASLRDQQYIHVGQAWVFLDYAGGDVAASHATTAYQGAIAQQIETNQIPSFPTRVRT